MNLVSYSRNSAGLPKRIIFSRKGCDAAAGGCPSIVLERQLVSIPIPEKHFEGGIPYEELCLPTLLRKPGRKTYGDLINALPNAKRGSLSAVSKAHADPDIREDLWSETPRDWQPRFGQCCSFDAPLDEVEPGDLFLFFGWFVEASWNDHGIVYKSTGGFHALWGWLRVVLPPERSVKPIAVSHHPHYKPKLDGRDHKASRNSVYTGYSGLFQYSNTVRMTHPACRQGCRSLWRLPRLFHQRLFPLPPDAWVEEGTYTTVQAAGQCQEYVFERPANGSLDESLRMWLDELGIR